MIHPDKLILFFSGLIDKIIKTEDLPGKRVEVEFYLENNATPITVPMVCEVHGLLIYQNLFTIIGMKLREHRNICHIKVSLKEDPKRFNLHIDEKKGIYEEYYEDLAFRTDYDLKQFMGGFS